MGVQVRWDRNVTEPAGEYTFFYGKKNENHELGRGCFVHKRIISAVKRVEFVSGGMSYAVLRGHWYDIIALNVHVPTEDNICDIVTDLINALPDNRSVNTNRGNSKRETVFYAVRAEQKRGDIGSLLPGNAAVNMYPHQWETVFSVGSVIAGSNPALGMDV
jgi:hypothetical protein